MKKYQLLQKMKEILLEGNFIRIIDQFVYYLYFVSLFNFPVTKDSKVSDEKILFSADSNYVIPSIDAKLQPTLQPVASTNNNENKIVFDDVFGGLKMEETSNIHSQASFCPIFTPQINSNNFYFPPSTRMCNDDIIGETASSIASPVCDFLLACMERQSPIVENINTELHLKEENVANNTRSRMQNKMNKN